MSSWSGCIIKYDLYTSRHCFRTSRYIRDVFNTFRRQADNKRIIWIFNFNLKIVKIKLYLTWIRNCCNCHHLYVCAISKVCFNVLLVNVSFNHVLMWIIVVEKHLFKKIILFCSTKMCLVPWKYLNELRVDRKDGTKFIKTYLHIFLISIRVNY